MAIRRLAGGISVTSWSPMRMRPPETCSRPAIRRSVVDFPHPDGPSSTSREAAAASKLIESTAVVVLQCLLTFCTEIFDTALLSPLTLSLYARHRPQPRAIASTKCALTKHARLSKSAHNNFRGPLRPRPTHERSLTKFALYRQSAARKYVTGRTPCCDIAVGSLRSLRVPSYHFAHPHRRRALAHRAERRLRS